MPTPRADTAAVFDSIRQCTVLFGGRLSGGGAAIGDTLEWDGVEWTTRSASGPVARYNHAMAFDAARGVVVLFGGVQPGGTLRGDTWEWNGTVWTERAVAGPSARQLHQMAYDAARGVTLLFGGNDGTDRGDFWQWDGTAWTLISAPGPAARVGHAMAFDSDRGIVTLTGGVGAFLSREAWDWDGAAWTQRPNAAITNFHHRMVYDPVRHRMVVLGSNSGQLGLRVLDASGWSDLPMTGPPQRRGQFGMAYDSARSRVVLFGGLGQYGVTPVLLGDTAELDGTLAIATADRPLYGNNLRMVYDAARAHCLMFGGVINSFEQVTDTWRWDGRGWLRLATTGPTRRNGHAMAYDALRDRTVLFGGRAPALSSDTYEWNGAIAAWSLISTTGPSPRQGHTMAFDEARGVTLLFGGRDSSASNDGYRADTWRWDGVAWTLAATTGPSPSIGAAMAYDSDRQRVVLFGGYNAIGGSARYFGETWEWSGTSWTRRATTGPPARLDASLAYDRARRVTVLFGGSPSSGALANDAWEWNGSSWSQINLVGPSERSAAPMAYDAARGRTVLFGGSNGNNLGATDTWELTGNLRIVASPASINASPGEAATFAISAQSSSAVTYQWRKDGAIVANGPRVTGADTATLTINPIESADAGNYDARVTDVCGSFVTSRGATLNVQFTVPHTIGRAFTASTYQVESAFIPPDTMGDVGPGHIVEIINGRYSVYSKAGTRLRTDTLNGFWAAAGITRDGPFAFDPRVIYDAFAERWFACAVDNGRGPNNLLVAVSTDANPLNGWRGFKIDSDTDNSSWADFPMVGLSSDAVFIGVNMFTLGSAPFRTAVLALPKADLMAGTVAQRVLFQDVDPNLTGSTPHGVRSLDNSPQRLLLSSFNKSAGSLKRSSIGGTAGAYTLNTSGGFYSVAPRGLPPDALQPSGTPLDSSDSRFSGSPVQIGSSIWAVHTVAFLDRSAIEWYELDASSNRVLQSGVVREDGLDLYYPSLAVNSAGNLVIGFSASGPSLFASAYAVVGQTVGGVMQVGRPFLLHPGAAVYQIFDGIGRNRWGDYSATCIDPTDPFRFWTFQEFASATDTWSIRVTEIVLPGASGLCRADFSGDGDLNADDLADYINCYFEAPPCARADFNGDGGVDADDLAEFINEFFSGCP